VGVLRWWGGESRVEPSGVFVVVMAGGGLGGGVLGVFFCGGGGVEGLVWMETGYVLHMCEIQNKRKVEVIRRAGWGEPPIFQLHMHELKITHPAICPFIKYLSTPIYHQCNPCRYPEILIFPAHISP